MLLQCGEGQVCYLRGCSPHISHVAESALSMQDEIYQAFEDYQSGRLQDPKDNVWSQA